MKHLLYASTLLAFLSISAQAVTIVGADYIEVSVIAAPAGPIYVQGVRAVECDDTEEEWPSITAIRKYMYVASPPKIANLRDGGEYCAVEVRLKWTPSAGLKTVTVTGFDEYHGDSSESDVYAIELNQSTQTAVLVLQ